MNINHFSTLLSLAMLCFATASFVPSEVYALSCAKFRGKNGNVCVNPARVNVSNVVAFDEGTVTPSGLSIDIRQDVCDEESGDTEPFYETRMGFTVDNQLELDLFVVSVRHVLRDSQGRVKSQKVRLNSQVAPANTTDTSLSTFFLDISDGRKFLVGRTNRPFSDDPGVVRVRTILQLRDDRGTRYREVVTSSFSLGNIDRCN